MINKLSSVDEEAFWACVIDVAQVTKLGVKEIETLLISVWHILSEPLLNVPLCKACMSHSPSLCIIQLVRRIVLKTTHDACGCKFNVILCQLRVLFFSCCFNVVNSTTSKFGYGRHKDRSSWHAELHLFYCKFPGLCKSCSCSEPIACCCLLLLEYGQL